MPVMGVQSPHVCWPPFSVPIPESHGDAGNPSNNRRRGTATLMSEIAVDGRGPYHVIAFKRLSGSCPRWANAKAERSIAQTIKGNACRSPTGSICRSSRPKRRYSRAIARVTAPTMRVAPSEAAMAIAWGNSRMPDIELGESSEMTDAANRESSQTVGEQGRSIFNDRGSRSWTRYWPVVGISLAQPHTRRLESSATI